MLTTDRVGGAALVALGLVVLFESRRLPLGSLHNPPPASTAGGLAALLVAAGGGLRALGASATRLAAVGWAEWRHAVAIFTVCAFAALALERLGYRLNLGLVLVILLGLVAGDGGLFPA